MKALKIKPELLSILRSVQPDTFIAPELTRAYLNIPKHHAMTRSAAGQIVLRSLIRLEQNNLIARTEGPQGRSVRYQFTPKFSGLYDDNIPVSIPQGDEGTSTHEDFSRVLQTRLNSHKQELLIAMGEVAEYEDICREKPSELDDLQDLYDNASEHYSKTLGRVKALESLIARQSIRPL